MATPKKQSTTKSPVSSMGLTFESGNPDNYPIAYVDNVWDIAAANSQLALKLGNSGQFDQHTINEDLATAARTNAAAIETLNKTDGSAGSIKKIVDDAIAKVVAEAPAAFDTLKEMSDWIAEHTEDATAMNTAIQGKVDKVNGKGLSENDFTTTEKSKLAAIDAGAQVNAIEHIKVNNTEQTITDKTVNIVMPTAANEYVYICKNYAGGTSATILAATHGCGATPIVTCWLNNKIVELDVTKNTAGDITIGWNGTTTISAQNPLTICVIGMSVTPDDEQQPTPTVPDASDFPYLIFEKYYGDDGRAVVKANNEVFAETTLEIPEAIILNGEELVVTNIDNYGFYDCESLVEITIPGSCKYIGANAFNGCSNLQSVTMEEGVESFDYDAFQNCSSLTEITIPASITSFGEGAFSYCDNLTTVVINCANISWYAFGGVSSITSLTLNNVESIGEGAFSGCSGLESVTIPNSVTSIGSEAFAYLNSNCTIYCEAASQPADWASDWTDCENVVWGYEPETIEENCPECGQPMWDGECTNTSCPNSPYYDQGGEVEPIGD